jgi:hypothetical protein
VTELVIEAVVVDKDPLGEMAVFVYLDLDVYIQPYLATLEQADLYQLVYDLLPLGMVGSDLFELLLEEDGFYPPIEAVVHLAEIESEKGAEVTLDDLLPG